MCSSSVKQIFLGGVKNVDVAAHLEANIPRGEDPENEQLLKYIAKC
jgi:hypothetical protein